MVIATYNRKERTSKVLDYLFVSDATEFYEVEIIVVDDGSPDSLEEMVKTKSVPDPFSLRFIRQKNTGPAGARNTGFRNASYPIVLFNDDDVLVSSNLLIEHYTAHEQNPNSVVFAWPIYERPIEETSSFRYLDKIEVEGIASITRGCSDKYIESKLINSGSISVVKEMFNINDGVYDESLTKPMSEEIELTNRLDRLGIKKIFVQSISAVHLQPTSIEDKCEQDFKWGTGITEYGLRRPIEEHSELLKYTMRVNGFINEVDPFSLKLRKAGLTFLSKKRNRETLLWLVKCVEKFVPNKDKYLFPLYTKIVGIYYFAGIREFLK